MNGTEWRFRNFKDYYGKYDKELMFPNIKGKYGK